MLKYAFVTLNQIEESYIFGKVSANAAAERLRGVLILLENLHSETSDESLLPMIEREIRGTKYLIDLYDAIKERD